MTANVEEKPYVLPALDFEFVVVDAPSKENDDPSNDQGQEEYDFPLFSMGSTDAISNKDEENSISEPHLIKVTLAEEEDELDNAIKRINKRPETYYFKHFTEIEKLQIKQSCIEPDDIISSADVLWNSAWPQFNGPVINLAEYNNNVEQAQLRFKKLSKRKPGQRQRVARKEAKQKVLEREEKRLSLKKKFRKRGGKKNKKISPLAHAGKKTTA
ncbi:hypothetical protein ACO0QE_001184 [Hanseniaspora vineae]